MARFNCPGCGSDRYMTNPKTGIRTCTICGRTWFGKKQVEDSSIDSLLKKKKKVRSE